MISGESYSTEERNPKLHSHTCTDGLAARSEDLLKASNLIFSEAITRDPWLSRSNAVPERSGGILMHP